MGTAVYQVTCSSRTSRQKASGLNFPGTTTVPPESKVASVEAGWAVERMKLYGKIAPILTDQQRRKIAGFERRADNFAGGAIARLGERSDN